LAQVLAIVGGAGGEPDGLRVSGHPQAQQCP